MLNKLSSLRAQGVSEEGFTLIELIIVVVIIGILSAIAIPIFLNQQKSAIAAGVKSDVRNTNTNIATALVKAPTATTVGATGNVTAAAPWFHVGTTAAAAAAATESATNNTKAVVSDANTRLVIAGDWDGYTITGTNTGLTGAGYAFDSVTGKYAGAGDYA